MHTLRKPMRPVRIVSALASASLLLTFAFVAPAQAADDTASTPVINSSITSTPATGNALFAWNEVAGATRYAVEVYVGPTATGTPLLTTETTALRWAPTSLLSTIAESGATEYSWRVGSLSGSSTTPVWSDVEVFSRTAVSASSSSYAPQGTLSYPTNSVEFKWPAVVGAKGYKLEHATNPDLTSPDTIYTTSTMYSPTFPINRLTASEDGGVKHYWRVTPLDAPSASSNQVGVASDIFTFDVVWTNDQPVLTYPATDPVPEFNDLSFEWNPVAGAKYYVFELSETKEGKATHTAIVPTTTYTPKVHLYQKTYYWRVTAYDANGQRGRTSAQAEVIRNWGNDLSAEFQGVLVTPEPTTSSTGIDWSQATADNPVEVTFDQLELAWEPVHRAAYYQVNVSDQNDLIDFSAGLSCLTPNTQVSPTYGTGQINGTGHLGKYYQGLSSNCLTLSGDAASAKNLQVGGTYSWVVEAVDNDATSNSAPKLNDKDSSESERSERRYFTLVSGASDSTPQQMTILSEGTRDSSGTPHILSPTPLLSWTPISGYDYTEVVIRMAKSKAASQVVRTYVRGASTLRLNGILENSTTTEPYRWTIAGCNWVNNGMSCQSVVQDSEDVTDERPVAAEDKLAVGVFGRFTKLSPTVDFVQSTVKSEYASDDFAVSWESNGLNNLSKGGSAGYSVQISKKNDTTASPVITEKVETNSWQYAQGTATSNSALKLVYGEEYVLKVAPLDALKNAGTYNSGIAFKLKNPASPNASAKVSSSGVSFSWNEMSSAVKYGISYALEGKSTWTNVGYTSSKPSLTQRSVTIPLPAVDGTYQWRISTVDRNGTVSSAVAQANFIVKAATGSPTLTTADKVTLQPKDRLLTWNSVAGASRYKVFLVKNSASFTSVGFETVQTQFAPIGTAAKFSTSTDLLYSAGLYKWKVQALNEAGSVIGESVTRTFSVENAPTKPSLGSVKADGTTLTATWTPLTLGNRGTNGAVTYQVQYRPVTFPESSFTSLPNTANDAGQVSISSLKKATTYEVKVRAKNSIGYSDWSTSRTATTLDTPSTPTASAPTSTLDSFKLSWSTSGAAATSFEVRYRPSTSNSWTTSTVTSKSFTATGLKANTTYYWEVRGKNGAGFGPSATGSLKTLALPGTPSSVAAKSGDKFATITWKAPSAGSKPITRYAIERRSYNAKSKKWSAWSSAGSSTATSYKASSLVNGTSYQFRVAATTQLGKGSFSAAASVVPAGKPIAAKVKAVSSKKKQIKITWSGAQANGKAITKHKVQVSTNGKKWTTVKTAKASAKSFTYKKAKSKKKYYVRVLTYNKLGYTASPVTTVTVK